MRWISTGGLLLMSFLRAAAGEPTLQNDIDLVLRQGRGTAEGRTAWLRLSQAKADAVPMLLEGLSTRNTVAANWLRTALDRVVEREMQAGGKQLDQAKILRLVKDASKEGRARRFALELLERVQPGTSAGLYPGWLDDPEFRQEAVALVLVQARTSAQAGDLPKAVELYKQAFEKSREVAQVREAAAGLQAANLPVSVARHLGFFTVWHVIGPFDGKQQKGFHLSYPPEDKVDLQQELEGQGKKVRWRRYQVRESSPTNRTGHQALVNLRDPAALGDADDAVAYAFTEFHVEKAMDAEMRGAADDNFTVWLNGAKVFAFEEWRNGVRHDRHRFPVRLHAGRNTVLVKICQSAAPNPEPNWEFFLRLVDATGKGIETTGMK